MSSNLTLQEKINNRIALIKNLDENLVREQRSMRTLRDQLAEHEVAMAERDQAGTDNVRWTTWANRRLAGMQLQLDEGDKRIERILAMIVGHESAIRSLQAGPTSSERQTRRVTVSRVSNLERQRRLESPDFQKEVASNLVKTVAAIEGRKVKKGKTRRYVAKGERKKSANAQQPAKKEKQQKNEKRGRKAA